MAGGRDERVGDLFFVDQSSQGNPSEEGLVRYVNQDLKAYIGSSVVSLVSGTGMTEPVHEILDTLVHELAETCYQDVTKTGGLVSSIVFWDTADKIKKVRELIVARTGALVSTITVKQYDGSGVLKDTLTGTVSRTGGLVDSISWIKS